MEAERTADLAVGENHRTFVYLISGLYDRTFSVKCGCSIRPSFICLPYKGRIKYHRDLTEPNRLTFGIERAVGVTECVRCER